MPTPYQIALFLVRLSAAIGITAGLACATVAIVIIVLGAAVMSAGWLDVVPSSFLSYGAIYLVIGIAELIFSKRIAQFAAKALES